jgi:hypothetical protein
MDRILDMATTFVRELAAIAKLLLDNTLRPSVLEKKKSRG